MKIILTKDGKPIDQINFTGTTVIIGRKSDCDVSIKDPAVSGRHAKLTKFGDSYVIQDLGSTNGIYYKDRRPSGHFIIHVDGGEDKLHVPIINGEPIGFESRRLERGDQIEVAGIEMEYGASGVPD